MWTAFSAHEDDLIHDDTKVNHKKPEVEISAVENGREFVSNEHEEAAVLPPAIQTTASAQPTAAEAAQMFVFSAAKAGMKDVDKEHVQKVVFEMSKDSLFFQNSIKQNEKVEARIASMRTKLQALSTARRDTLRRQIDAQVAKLETSRDLTRTKVVVDMDMFYAAVEMRDNPSLRDKPLAVGGIGMLSTTNYVARKFGVRAAMPGFIGKELCPDLVIVPTNFPKYTAISAQIREIVARYDPDFHAMSLDEVYCDITDYMESHWTTYARTGTTAMHSDHSNTDESDGDEEEEADNFQEDGTEDACEDEENGERDTMTNGICESGPNSGRRMRKRVSSVVPPSEREAIAAAIVAEIRRKIFETTQLTASAGIAANTMLAKICSDFNKPNGQFVLPFARDDILAFVEKLPVRKIGGIGKVMEKTLNAALGVTTGKDLFDHRVEIFHLFSDRTASWLLRIALGLQGSSDSEERGGRKSYSRERTFSARGIGDSRTLEKICEELCERLAADMDQGGYGAKTITLKLKCVDFSVRSRAVSTTRTVRSKDDLYAYAVELLRKEMPLRLRLLGVRASVLVELDGTSLTDGNSSTRKRQAVMDAFTTAATYDPDVSNDHQWTDEDDRIDEAKNEDSDNFDTVKNRLLPKKQLAIQAFTQKQDIGESSTSEERSQRLQNQSSRPRSSLFRTTSQPGEAPDAAEFQPCPICGKMINAGNAIAIDVHVDACLRQAQNQQKKRNFQQFFRS